MNCAVLALLVEMMVPAVLFGQAAPSATQIETFHIQGTIKDPNDAVIPKAEVTFESKTQHKTVIANDVGLYAADLPLGNYTMIARNRFFKTRRIVFRVAPPGGVVVNGTAFPLRLTCDIVVVGGDVEEASKDWCGGEDTFLIPSNRDSSSTLYIEYPRRKSTDSGWIYTSDYHVTNYPTPVFVEYGFFSLQADEVTYDAKHLTLAARGNVIVEDGASKRNADWATFKLESGKAIQLN